MKGIPSFWLTIFKNVDMLSEMVQVSFKQCSGSVGSVSIWASQIRFSELWYRTDPNPSHHQAQKNARKTFIYTVL